jgi:hypothetical protein
MRQAAFSPGNAYEQRDCSQFGKWCIMQASGYVRCLPS